MSPRVATPATIVATRASIVATRAVIVATCSGVAARVLVEHCERLHKVHRVVPHVHLKRARLCTATPSAVPRVRPRVRGCSRHRRRPPPAAAIAIAKRPDCRCLSALLPPCGGCGCGGRRLVRGERRAVQRRRGQSCCAPLRSAGRSKRAARANHLYARRLLRRNGGAQTSRAECRAATNAAQCGRSRAFESGMAY